MPEIVIHCAGCGKRYKGASGPKKYKCNICSNLFTFPESPRAPQEGSLLCSCCWTGVAASPELDNCPVCSQKIALRFGGRASLSANGSSPQLIFPSSDEAAPSRKESKELVETPDSRVFAESFPERPKETAAEPDHSRADLQAKISALQDRLELWQESQAMALRERDEIARARQTLDVQNTDLLSRLTALQETHMKTTVERDSLLETNRRLDKSLVELESRMRAGHEGLLAVQAERDEAIKARNGAETSMIELKARLSAANEAAAELKKERDTLVEQFQAARVKAAESSARIEAVRTGLAGTQQEREEAQREVKRLEARVVELETRLKISQESLEKVEQEREKNAARAEKEREQFIQSQTRLTHFQDLAVAALRPLSAEYDRITKELIGEIEGLLTEARQAQEDFNQRRLKLKTLEGDLLGQISSAAREAERMLTAGPVIQNTDTLAPSLPPPSSGELKATESSGAAEPVAQA